MTHPSSQALVPRIPPPVGSVSLSQGAARWARACDGPVRMSTRTALWTLRRGLWQRRWLIVRLVVWNIVFWSFGVLLAFAFQRPYAYRGCNGSHETTSLLRAQQFVEAHTEWSLNNDATCPANLRELTKYMNSKDTADAWGNPLLIVCGPEAPEGVPFGVTSAGQDKTFGTLDDIKSWEGRKRRHVSLTDS